MHLWSMCEQKFSDTWCFKQSNAFEYAEEKYLISGTCFSIVGEIALTISELE